MPSFSYIGTSFERSKDAVEDIERFENYSLIEIAGKRLIRTGQNYNRGWMARHFHSGNALNTNPEEVVSGKPVDEFTFDDWAKVADAEGLPETCPASLWGIENVHENRAKFFANVVLSKHEMNLIGMLATSHANGRPGKYRPTILEGDAGCGKTQAALAFAALCGMPYMEAKGVADDDKAGIVVLEGGDAPKTKTRGAVMKSLAHYGIFETPKGMAEFYRTCGQLIKDGKAKNVKSAFSRITDSQWHDIAGIEGMPDEGDAIAVQVLGLAEIGRRMPGGALINFDEINMFSEFMEGRVMGYFNNHNKKDQAGTCFVGTMNPPSEKFPNRRALAYDSLSRVEVRSAQKPDLEQVTDLTMRFFGYSGSSDDRVAEADMINKALSSDKDLSDAERAGFMKMRDRNAIYTQLLTEKAAGSIAASIAEFHCRVEPMTTPGGQLHPSDYGSDASPAPVDLRTIIDSFFGGLGNGLADKALELKPELVATIGLNSAASGEDFVSCLTKPAIADVVCKTLRESYVDRLNFCKPSMGRAITKDAQFSPKDSSLPILNQLLKDCGLTPAALAKVIEINRPESAPEWAMQMAKTFSQEPNPKNANPRGFLKAIEKQSPELADAIATKDERLALDKGCHLNDVVLVPGATSSTILPLGQRTLDNLTVEFAEENTFTYGKGSKEELEATNKRAGELAPKFMKRFFADGALPMDLPLDANGYPVPGSMPVGFFRDIAKQCQSSHMKRLPDYTGDGVDFAMIVPIKLPNDKLIGFCAGEMTLPDGKKHELVTWISEEGMLEYCRGALLDRDQNTAWKFFPGTKNSSAAVKLPEDIKCAMEHRRLFVYTAAGEPLNMTSKKAGDVAEWTAEVAEFSDAMPKSRLDQKQTSAPAISPTASVSLPAKGRSSRKKAMPDSNELPLTA